MKWIKKKYYNGIIKWSIGVGLFLFILFFVIFLIDAIEWEFKPFNSAKWGQLGDVVGGVAGTIFSFAGILLLILTLKSQRKALKVQQKEFSKQEIKTHFYTLLGLHMENVRGMRFLNYNGREVFIPIVDAFEVTYDHFKAYYTSINLGISDKEAQKVSINISYLIVFFGFSEKANRDLIYEVRKILNDDSKFKAFESYLARFKILKVNDDRFDGYLFLLGHYYRHLFQTVKYVHNQPDSIFTEVEKRDLLKTLRAQLSTHEQALLFCNSLSRMGSPWELAVGVKKKDQLITKYNMIKNIPRGFLKDIDVSIFFPAIEYEFNE